MAPLERRQDDAEVRVGKACRGQRSGAVGLAQFLWIPWRLPKLNELLDARIRVFTPKGGKSRGGATRKHVASLPNAYTVMKREWEGCIAMLARTRGFSVLPGCWDFTYLFVEPNSKFDPSNISAAAIKFIEDALVKDKRMEGDGWATVHSITCLFEKVSPDCCSVPGVLLAIGDAPVELTAMAVQAMRMSNAERFHRRANTVHATAVRKSASIRGGLPGGNQSVGEAPAVAPAPSRPVVRAQRATGDGRRPAADDSGK